MAAGAAPGASRPDVPPDVSPDAPQELPHQSPPPSQGQAPRACPLCLRAHCVCACLAQTGVPWRGPVELLILQHPREQREPKGTARLLHQAVAGSRLLIGERWDAAPDSAAPREADAESGRDACCDSGCAPGRRDLLLYPATPGDAALPEPPPLPPEWLRHPGLLRLVVIDGTWRKSRRMLYESPWLQRLPRLTLVAPPASRYRIRRARGEGQLSTFEAGVLALAQLAPTHDPGTALWPVFEAFVAGALARQANAHRAG